MQPASPAPRAAPGRPRLGAPHLRFRASFLAALEEYLAEGRHLDLPAALLADPAEPARRVAALRASVARPGAAERYLGALGAAPELPGGGRIPQEAGYVLQEAGYVLQEGDDVLQGRGHIGYEVRPSARGLGHATAMLAAVLPLAAALDIRLVYANCEAGNAALRPVIEKNGGRLDRAEGDTIHFLVPTGLGGS